MNRRCLRQPGHPAVFTASLLSLAGPPLPAGAHPSKPSVELLANTRAGTVGACLASGVLEPAIAKASRQIGAQLRLSSNRTSGLTPAMAAVLADRSSTRRTRFCPPELRAR